MARVDMDEIAARIIADPAQGKIKGRLAQSCGADPGDTDIQGPALQMQTATGHLPAALDEQFIITGGTKPRDDVNIPAAPHLLVQQAQILNGADVDGVHLVGVMTAQQMVDGRKGLLVVAAIALPKSGLQTLACVEMEQGESGRPCFFRRQQSPCQPGSWPAQGQGGEQGGLEKGPAGSAAPTGKRHDDVLQSRWARTTPETQRSVAENTGVAVGRRQSR